MAPKFRTLGTQTQTNRDDVPAYHASPFSSLPMARSHAIKLWLAEPASATAASNHILSPSKKALPCRTGALSSEVLQGTLPSSNPRRLAGALMHNTNDTITCTSRKDGQVSCPTNTCGRHVPTHRRSHCLHSMAQSPGNQQPECLAAPCLPAHPQATAHPADRSITAQAEAAINSDLC